MLKNVILFFTIIALFSSCYNNLITLDEARSMDNQPPADIRNLNLLPSNEIIAITWLNPKDSDFEGVSITINPFLNPEDTRTFFVDRSETSYIMKNVINGVEYQVSIQSRDYAGNQAVGISDTSTPFGSNTALITSKPAPFTKLTTADFQITGVNLAKFKYRVDKTGSWTELIYGSPIGLTGLSEGEHIIEVLGQDPKGLWQNELYPTAYQWVVDHTNPVMPTHQGYLAMNSKPFNLTWVPDPAEKYSVLMEYSLDGGSSWLVYASPTLFNLPADNQISSITVKARQTDQAGNVSPVNTISFQIAGNMTVHYNTYGGTAIPDKKVEYGTLAPQPAAPVKSGYIFRNWYKEAGYTNVWNFASDPVVSETTIHVKWGWSYTITFDSAGGSTVSPVTITEPYTTATPFPANPTFNSNTAFVSWQTEPYPFAKSTTFTSATPVTGNITVYAKWSYDPKSILTIGSIGPAGGKIFYINPDADRDGWKYLEAGTVNLSQTDWGANKLKIGTYSAIGTGADNTLAIVKAISKTESGKAAQLCYNYTLNGYSDWFLPSYYELKEMYNNKAVIGNFPLIKLSYFASSTEYPRLETGSIYAIDFYSGTIASKLKTDVLYIRPVRMF